MIESFHLVSKEFEFFKKKNKEKKETKCNLMISPLNDQLCDYAMKFCSFFISRVIIQKSCSKTESKSKDKLAEEQHKYNCSETSYNIITA